MCDLNMNSRLLSVILLLHIQVSITLALHTICDKTDICAVKGADVTMKCIYSKYMDLKTAFWFSQKQSDNWRKKEEPEDLSLDSDYAGRVETQIIHTRSELKITDLRETDSGEYQLMFIMIDGRGVKHLSFVTFNLTVTDLQVKINHESEDQRVKLICDSSCTPDNYYYWQKNGWVLSETLNYMLVSSDKKTNRYSCSVYPYKSNPSSSVCVSNSSCWNVIYPSRSVCALVGSTVNIYSTYSHPTGYTVEKTLWHKSLGVIDLREEQQFAGRVEYVGNTLRIKDVKISDSGEYQFRIISNKDLYSGSPGVILTVTDTKVTISPEPVAKGEKVILSCLTQCTLDNKHTYTWYKNGQQVTDGFTLLNKLYLDSVSSEEIPEYSCTMVADPEPQHTWLQNTAVILSVFLALVLIGVLWYGIRRRILSKNYRDAKEEAQYEVVYIDAVPSELKQKDCSDQDIHYSSIKFGHMKNKPTSTVSTAVCPTDTTENGEVHYSAVMFSKHTVAL